MMGDPGNFVWAYDAGHGLPRSRLANSRRPTHKLAASSVKAVLLHTRLRDKTDCKAHSAIRVRDACRRPGCGFASPPTPAGDAARCSSTGSGSPGPTLLPGAGRSRTDTNSCAAAAPTGGG